jgi:hypothetical protein
VADQHPFKGPMGMVRSASGSNKTTGGAALAGPLSLDYADVPARHSDASVAQLVAGHSHDGLEPRSVGSPTRHSCQS